MVDSDSPCDDVSKNVTDWIKRNIPPDLNKL